VCVSLIRADTRRQQGNAVGCCNRVERKRTDTLSSEHVRVNPHHLGVQSSRRITSALRPCRRVAASAAPGPTRLREKHRAPALGAHRRRRMGVGPMPARRWSRGDWNTPSAVAPAKSDPLPAPHDDPFLKPAHNKDRWQHEPNREPCD